MKALAAKTLAVAAAFSLTAAPAVAGPGGHAAKLSIARAATPGKHANGLAGAPVVAFLGLAAFIAGTVIIVHDDKRPRSP